KIVLNPNDGGWVGKLKEQLAGQKVDMAIDNIAGPLLAKVIETLGMNGRVSCIGQLAGPGPNFSAAPLVFKRVLMRGVFGGAYSASEARQAWNKVVELMKKNGAKPIVDSSFQFHD